MATAAQPTPLWYLQSANRAGGSCSRHQARDLELHRHASSQRENLHLHLSRSCSGEDGTEPVAIRKEALWGSGSTSLERWGNASYDLAARAGEGLHYPTVPEL